MILQDKLKEIELRANAATDGPWYPLNNHGTHIFEPSLVFGEAGIIAKGSEAFIGQRYLASGADIEKLGNNLRFIAHARADIPKLLAVIKLLIEQRDYVADYPIDGFEDIREMNNELAKILEEEK